MNRFESVIIVNPEIKEDEMKKLIDKISNFINENGSLISVDELGKKKLAYKVKGFNEGFYIVFTFETEFKYTVELEKTYQKMDKVIKFIVVKAED